MAASDWSAWPVTTVGDYGPELPLLTADARVRYNDVGSYALAVPFTPERWQALGRGARVQLRRNRRHLIAGPIVERQLVVDDEHPGGRIEVVGESDEALLADRIVFPDPTRAGTAQTVATHWTRSGPAETVIKALANEQTGAGALADRRVPDLVIEPDTGSGVTVSTRLRYHNLLDALQVIAGGDEAQLAPAIEASDRTEFPPVDLAKITAAEAQALRATGWRERAGAPVVEAGIRWLYHPRAPQTPPPINYGDVPEEARVLAALAIQARLKSGQPIYEDWTWRGAPLYVNDHNDYLIGRYFAAGGSWTDRESGAGWLGRFADDAKDTRWKQHKAAGWGNPSGDTSRRLFPPVKLMTYVRPAQRAQPAVWARDVDRVRFWVEPSRDGRVLRVARPVDLSATVRFSLALGNLAALTYRESAPTATYALAGGKGDLTARIQREWTVRDPEALAYGRRIERYVDQRQLDDDAELTIAARQAVRDGSPVKTLPLTPAGDSDLAVDQLVGALVTVYVGPVGYTNTATVVDLVREVHCQLDVGNGTDTATPVIGTDGATADSLGTFLRLDRIDRRVANLERT